MELNFTVNDQLLVLNNDVHDLSMVSDSINNVQCKFVFNNTWDGYLKRVYFKNSSYSILKPVLLESDNTCIVPWECLSSTGVITCAVVGSKFSNGKLISRLTTNTVVMLIQREESIVKDGFEPTGTEFEQVLGTLLDYADVLISLDTDIKDIQEYVDNTVLDFDSYVEAAEAAVEVAVQSAHDAAAAVDEAVSKASEAASSAFAADQSAQSARLAVQAAQSAAEDAARAAQEAEPNDIVVLEKQSSALRLNATGSVVFNARDLVQAGIDDLSEWVILSMTQRNDSGESIYERKEYFVVNDMVYPHLTITNSLSISVSVYNDYAALTAFIVKVVLMKVGTSS